ncbi:flippase [Candidatus Pacearchaeota archaeon]|nr:flippase [Candidatus Pacearchaeota archaeon]
MNLKKGNEKNAKFEKSLHLVAKSSLIVLIGVALSKIFTYLYRIIIGRNFGPEVYGLFSLATMLLIFIVAFFSFGLPEGLVRFIPFYRGKNQKKEISYLIKRSFSFLLSISIFGTLLLFLLSEPISVGLFHNAKLIPFLRIASLAIPFFILANFYLAILRAYEFIGVYSFILNFLQNFFKVISLLFFIFIGIRTNVVMYSYFIGILIMFLGAYYACDKYAKVVIRDNLEKKKKKEVIGSLFSYSWPLTLLGVASFALYWIDSFTIGYFKTAADVGFYNAAIPLASLLMMAPDLIIQLFFPLVNKEYSKRNNKLIEELSKQVTKWIFIVNLPFALIMLLFPGAIINLFFGETYLVAEQSLRLLAIGTLFGSLAIVPSHLISMTGRSKLMLTNITFMLGLNLLLNILLVPKYGMLGAALSTMSILILLSIVYFTQIRYFLSFIPLRRKMINILLASLIPLIIISVLKNLISLNFITVIILGTFFLLLYGLFIFIFKCLDKNDLLILKPILKRYFMTTK